MATSKTTKKKLKTATRWHDGTTSIDDLEQHEQLAHQIVSQFRDLAPSVERIMNATITEDQRLHALTAFKDSLGKAGDPNRDPRVAIEAAVSAA